LTDFLQVLVSGAATGCVYALVALGFTLLWQAAGAINFAQGEFVMLPTFAMLSCLAFGAPLWLAFLLACALSMAILGLAFKRLIADPVAGRGVMVLVIATLGLAVVAKSVIKAAYGAEAHPFPSIFPEALLALGPLKLSFQDLGTLLVAAAMVVGLHLFLSRTSTGRAMQAVAQNAEAATVLGINVSRMVLYVFLINALLVTIGALLVAPTYLAKFDMGDSLGLKAFYAAIIGGFNQSRGALLGGLLVGILENLVGAYVSPGYKDGVALMVFMVVILFRPEGLLGRPEERRV
jgi:branched-chain amino acid transport system permease protein